MGLHFADAVHKEDADTHNGLQGLKLAEEFGLCQWQPQIGSVILSPQCPHGFKGVHSAANLLAYPVPVSQHQPSCLNTCPNLVS